jgi:hypothetical protein
VDIRHAVSLAIVFVVPFAVLLILKLSRRVPWSLILFLFVFTPTVADIALTVYGVLFDKFSGAFSELLAFTLFNLPFALIFWGLWPSAIGSSLWVFAQRLGLRDRLSAPALIAGGCLVGSAVGALFCWAIFSGDSAFREILFASTVAGALSGPIVLFWKNNLVAGARLV